MVTLSKILETYSLGEILELNDLSELEVLELLVEEKLVTELEPVPVDATFKDIP